MAVDTSHAVYGAGAVGAIVGNEHIDAPLSLASICHGVAVEQRLLRGGLSAEDAAQKAPLFASAARALQGLSKPSAAAARAPSGSKTASAFFVPGRIEVMGKHTDYCGGRSLLAAINKGFAIVTVPRDDARVRVVTLEAGISADDREITLALDPSDTAAYEASDPGIIESGHWSKYVAVAVRRLASNFVGQLKGLELAIGCDIPPASGMSTSSALICAIYMALSARAGVELTRSERFRAFLGTPERLYEYLGCIENGQSFVCAAGTLVGDAGVGTFGGSEDHTAIMACEPGSLKMFSYCPTRLERTVPFPPDVTFVIAVSGAIAEKTGEKMSDYNNAALLSFAAAGVWAERSSHPKTHLLVKAIDAADNAGNDASVRAAVAPIGFDTQSLTAMTKAAGSAVDSALEDGDAVAQCAAAGQWASVEGAVLLRRRAEQFFAEQVLTLAVADAFSTADYVTLGKAVGQSQSLTDTHLCNLVPETRFLPTSATELGALAASAFGAGFGGSAYAIVQTTEAAEFIAKWKHAYASKFPDASVRSMFFPVQPGPGAFEL